MTQTYQNLIQQAYDAFNRRDIDAVLSLMHKEVHWPNGWEGGYVNGHNEVRDYWTRQWKELDPHVKPVAFKDRGNNQLQVAVQQTIKDLKGNLVFEGTVNHIYTIENGLIKSMEIEKQ